ncbi:MAG: sodium:calcium antiporter, partial [Patescibacteria group bacterium]|nr:sodium:calcium antiporter [Patescibacteria group bacterium]
MLILWLIIFIISLVLLVKGADWLVESAEKIAITIGIPSFIAGIIIVGAGTSLPELISSLFAALRGLTDVPGANTIGSNIANI